MPIYWVATPTRLPLVIRRCHACAAKRFRATGRFRVNANHKLIDAWLLIRCTGCAETAKLAVLERIPVRTIRPGLLCRLQDDDPVLAAELLQDPGLCRRQRIALDWDNAWRLAIDESDHPAHADKDGERIEVSVHFAARIPVRPVRLIAQGRGLSRAEVRRLIDVRKLVSEVRLDSKRSSDFTFMLEH
ncbi:hypothetical protein EV191_108101 [Tamaricihabitans halophyticus]|uniref:DUF1062 domain-containing protein n=1 Tax=Tamaricihabitans halophyticus TaxID=1262583 RepID=A0A4R2QSP2_9PSEU|nr:DUF1062 domain-containing protein [Tamaricihabitans halophyticus]TCP50015.1 hypothetical protein EV191_108101 [Tamaricihabitans halophyticus]